MSNRTPDPGSIDAHGQGARDKSAVTIARFKAVFDADEDRVRFETVDQESGTQVIYVTKRLLDSLIPVLAENLVKTGPSSALARRFAQDGARSNPQNWAEEIPVATFRDAPKWLCRTVRVSPREGGLVLTFSDDTQRVTRMPLIWADIRPFLDLLLVTYRRGSWVTSVFPDWIRPSPQMPRHAQTHRLN